MGECKIDHSLQDVQKKYQSQIEFLPPSLQPLFKNFFQQDQKQEVLNEIFHLLKKYDLSSEEEQEVRNRQMFSTLKKQ